MWGAFAGTLVNVRVGRATSPTWLIRFSQTPLGSAVARQAFNFELKMSKEVLARDVEGESCPFAFRGHFCTRHGLVEDLRS